MFNVCAHICWHFLLKVSQHVDVALKVNWSSSWSVMCHFALCLCVFKCFQEFARRALGKIGELAKLGEHGEVSATRETQRAYKDASIKAGTFHLIISLIRCQPLSHFWRRRHWILWAFTVPLQCLHSIDMLFFWWTYERWFRAFCVFSSVPWFSSEQHLRPGRDRKPWSEAKSKAPWRTYQMYRLLLFIST